MPWPVVRWWLSNNTPSKKAGYARTAYGVPATNPRSAQARKIATRRTAFFNDHGSSVALRTIVAAMTPTDVITAPLYLVDAVSPAMTPATAHRRRRVGA